MKTYIGDRTIDGVVVEVNGQSLPNHTDIKQFTNADYEWGYEGLAATQLAFAMLYDHSGDASLAIRLAKPFMEEVTANFGNEWEMTTADMSAAIAQIETIGAG